MKNIVICLIEKMKLGCDVEGRTMVSTVSCLLTVDSVDIGNREVRHGGVISTSVIDQS